MNAPKVPWRYPSLRALLALALPVVLARAAQSVVGFADAALVAPLGPDALAATANGSLNALAVFMLPTGVVFIVQSFSAQFHGAGDTVALQRYAWYGLAVAAATEFAALAAIPLIPWALARSDYTPEVRGLMADFLALRLLGVGAAVGSEALGNWFAGQGNTRVALVSSVVVMCLNVPLAWALIHGGLGLPALGVRGAALASTVATAAGFVVTAIAFARAPKPTAPNPLQLRELARFVRYGLPNGVNWFVEFAAFLVFVDLVFARLGTPALAALMAVLQLNSMAFMPAFGVASAGAIQVGNALGADASDAVPALVRRTTWVAALWMLCVGIGYGAFPAALLALFAKGTGAQALASVGVRLLLVSVAWQLSDAVAVVLSEALRAAGDTTWPMAARSALAWLFFVPAAWWTAHAGGGPVATLLWVVVYITILAALLTWRFRAGAWRTMDLRGEGLGLGP